MQTSNVDTAARLPSFLAPKILSSEPADTRGARLDLSQTQSKAQSKTQSRTQAARKRVLVIDDEPSIADSLTEILIGHGYDALAFHSGRTAIDSARDCCPDLVISDVVMPKLNGVDTVLAIRERCPSTKILLFSGQAGTTNILEAARAEGHEFEMLPKPIHPEQLLKKLSTLAQS
jgi:DNA-binding NtrC family response regulator